MTWKAGVMCTQSLTCSSSYLTPARDMVKSLLVASPAERMTVDGIFSHPWISSSLKSLRAVYRRTVIAPSKKKPWVPFKDEEGEEERREKEGDEVNDKASTGKDHLITPPREGSLTNEGSQSRKRSAADLNECPMKDQENKSTSEREEQGKWWVAFVGWAERA